MQYLSESKLAAERVLHKIEQKAGKIPFPIDPFKLLKEYYDAIITFSDFDKLEGLLLLDNNKDAKSIISINLNRPVTRQRFTAAHELGHILLHSKIKNREFLCPISEKKSPIEKEADEFAANLLMPTDELNRMINKYQDEKGNVDFNQCLLISEYFGVSFEACVKTIRFRLNRFARRLNNDELNDEIKKYRPSIKRNAFFNKTNDLDLLRNAINYSYFSLFNINDIIGIKFMQNLIYHDNRIENINLTLNEISEIYADFRVNGSESKYCTEKNQNIIEVLGNIEMNQYCLTTEDEIDIFKIKKLNNLLYKYAPFPEYAGEFRTNDNLILGGQIQPISVDRISDEMTELDKIVNNLISNIEDYSVSDYIDIVSTIHYRLTVLHPFNDGNGRISRAFMNWLLRLKGLPPIYIDLDNKTDYLRALHKIDREKDNAELQIVIIKAIINTMAELHDSWN